MQTEFKCCSCGQVFEQQSALTGHIVDEHTTTNGSICDLCGKTFSHPSSVIYHKEVRSVGRGSSCKTTNSVNLNGIVCRFTLQTESYETVNFSAHIHFNFQTGHYVFFAIYS